MRLFTAVALALMATCSEAVKLVKEEEATDLVDFAECECDVENMVMDDEDDDMLAETEADTKQIPGVPGGGGGSQDMSAINLIENERNMHMVPPPPQPCCCCNQGYYGPYGPGNGYNQCCQALPAAPQQSQKNGNDKPQSNAQAVSEGDNKSSSQGQSGQQ